MLHAQYFNFALFVSHLLLLLLTMLIYSYLVSANMITGFLYISNIWLWICHSYLSHLLCASDNDLHILCKRAFGFCFV